MNSFIEQKQVKKMELSDDDEIAVASATAAVAAVT
jgi:hypothetical protein